MGTTNGILARLTGEERVIVVSFARVGSAFAFAVTVFLVSFYAKKWYGLTAGIGAGIALMTMPRLFAHAHLASLESTMNLTYTAFALVTIDRLSGKAELKVPDTVLPGILLGLAFLTKMQAIFLPPALTLWMLWHWKKQAILPIAVTGTIALTVFFAGWPWLWHQPWERFWSYFASAHERSTLYCHYLGERFTDKQVPWHYPLVMFVTTTPLVWLIPGLMGMFSRQGDFNDEAGHFWRKQSFLLSAFLLPLALFSLPRISVYDGERLFLVVWPIFAIWVGIGIRRIVSYFPAQRRQLFSGCLLAGLAIWPTFQIIKLHPCQLSYYNAAIGGLRGASALGMEATYWGDSVTPSFLREAAEQLPVGSRLGIAPVLHPATLTYMKRDSWLRHRPDITLEAYDDTNPQRSPFVIVIRRQADPWESLTPPPEGTEVLAQVTREGVVLAEFLKLPDSP